MNFNKLAIASLLGLFCGLTNAQADEITVSAAASLKDAFTQISANYAKVKPDTKINFNFGSSGTLQKQIEAGAPVDLFVSAADKNMDALAAQGEIDTATRRTLARGELVLVAPKGSKLKSIGELRLTSVKSLAIGGPGVPAGDYARQTLNNLRLTDVVSSKLVLCKDVRAVLAQVAAGNVEAGFVYRTDALTTPEVRIVAVAPPKSHTPVTYPVAVVKDAANRNGAISFLAYLQSGPSKKVLKRFGFK
jgi:molybdate transport system substrate-binding protein